MPVSVGGDEMAKTETITYIMMAVLLFAMPMVVTEQRGIFAKVEMLY